MAREQIRAVLLVEDILTMPGPRQSDWPDSG